MKDIFKRNSSDVLKCKWDEDFKLTFEYLDKIKSFISNPYFLYGLIEKIFNSDYSNSKEYVNFKKYCNGHFSGTNIMFSLNGQRL